MSAERSWVWVASPETVKAGKVSVLACVETVVMVALYWGIAWAFETHVHLLAGLLVMPLMLFRSDESVALGVKWAEKIRLQGLDHESVAVVSGILVYASFLVVYAIGTPFLLPVFFFSFFFLSLTYLLFPELLKKFPTQFLHNTILGSVAFIVFSFAGFAAMLLCVGLIHYLSPLALRCGASVMHLGPGLGNVSKNWRRIVFLTDTTVRPEPLPDPEGDVRAWSLNSQISTLKSAFHDYRQTRQLTDALTVFFTLILFAPAFLTSILFRWALKSTAWFYLPLLFLTAPYNPKNRLIWMRSFPRTVLTWVRLILSLIGIAVAITALIVDLPSALAAITLGQQMELPIVPLSLVLVLDWDQLHPWQYASLPTAILTVILFFRLDQLGRREQAGDVIAETGFALTSMVWADRIRSVLALAWLALITPPTLRFFHCAGQLPDWAARPLGWLFQPGACAIAAV